MRAGEFEDGKYTLRAKIDLASGNFNMRDPVIYRIHHMHHHRQGDKWCIYPMYDFAHPIQDALEGITHSLCSLEFEDHRPLYNWVVEQLCPCPVMPRQIEFARLGINYTVHEQAQAPRRWWKTAMSPAGTIPGCPPSAACAAGATPPPPSGISASAMGVAKVPQHRGVCLPGVLPAGGPE